MNHKTIWLLFFVLLKLVLQYSLADPSFDLHRDEYLHLDQANHPAWGYDSVPPFTSWISMLIKLLGNGVFWVKFFPALFGALTIVVVWKMVETLGGNLFALILSALAILLSVLIRINLLYQPNSADILAWTCFYYFLIKYFQTNKPSWIYAAAVIFAFGFLNKYNILFLATGCFPALLITHQRKIFFAKHFYLALLLALLIVTPNLLWQWNNGLPVIHHMKELAGSQLVNVQRSAFLREQLLFFFGSFPLLIAGIVDLFVAKENERYRFVIWSFLCTLLVFTYMKAKGYYAIGLYPVLIAFGAVAITKLTAHGWKQYLRIPVIAFQLLFAILLIRIAMPFQDADTLISTKTDLYRKMGLLRWEDGKEHHLQQDFADMLGWKELAEKTDQAWDSIPDKAHALVYCDNYGMTGAINYYSKRAVHAVSMNADYVNWFPPDSAVIRHLILVQEANDDDPERKKEQPLFEQIIRMGTIENKYAREKGAAVYLLLNAKVPIMPYFTKEINEVKQARNFFQNPEL